MPSQPAIGETQGRSGVYRLFNTATQRSYVGSTKDLRGRLNGHARDLALGRHCNPKLQHAWDKCGGEAWVFSVLEYCPLPELVQRERHWAKELGTLADGYNLQQPGNAHYPKRAGKRQVTEETRRRLSLALMGRKPEMTPARRASIEARRGVSLPHLRGRHHSKETRAKISRAKLGKPKPKGFGERMSRVLTGRSLPLEVRRKISERARGNQNQLGKVRLYDPRTAEARTVFPSVAQDLLARGWLRGMPRRATPGTVA